MMYPAVFSWDGESYQMYIPDIVGANAVSHGDDLGEALKTIEAIASEMLSANYKEYPKATELNKAQSNLMEKDDFIMSTNVAFTSGKNIRVTLSMPDYVLQTIDAAAKKQKVSRSAYLANLALGR